MVRAIRMKAGGPKSKQASAPSLRLNFLAQVQL
jgi:hypothetical protein